MSLPRSRALLWIAAVAAAVAACKGSRRDRAGDAGPAASASDAAPPLDASGPWPELAGYPTVAPDRVIALPARPDVPRFDVGGPAIAGDIAVVASSQVGFVGVDWRRGAIAWSKPAGAHVAPPLVIGPSVVLVGACHAPPALRDGERLLGCLRVVTHHGADELYTAIRGPAQLVEAFEGAVGPQSLWPGEPTADRGRPTVRWRRGDHAVAVDLISGVAMPAPATPPPLAFTHRDLRWTIAHEDGRVVGRIAGKRGVRWSTRNAYTALLGIVWTPEGAPLVRLVDLGALGQVPQLQLFDIDATGSLRATAARPAPGIGLLGWGVSTIGDAAIAVRLDASIQRDFVVGYAANAMLLWVYPLPEHPRADPVGVALAPEAVVVFHDGDTVTVLPELSAPPTAPGAGRAASQKPTP